MTRGTQKGVAQSPRRARATARSTTDAAVALAPRRCPIASEATRAASMSPASASAFTCSARLAMSAARAVGGFAIACRESSPAVASGPSLSRRFATFRDGSLRAMLGFDSRRLHWFRFASRTVGRELRLPPHAPPRGHASGSQGDLRAGRASTVRRVRRGRAIRSSTRAVDPRAV
jgi:hypothetical protein